MPAEEIQALASESDSDEGSDEETKDKGDDVLEEAYVSSGSKQVPQYAGPRRSKRSKRKRAG